MRPSVNSGGKSRPIFAFLTCLFLLIGVAACSSDTAQSGEINPVESIPADARFALVAYTPNDGRAEHAGQSGQILFISSQGRLTSKSVAGMLSGGISAQGRAVTLISASKTTEVTEKTTRAAEHPGNFERIPDQFVMPNGNVVGIANIGGDGSSYESQVVVANRELVMASSKLSGYVQSVGQCDDHIYVALADLGDPSSRKLWQITTDEQGQIKKEEVTSQSEIEVEYSMTSTIACARNSTVELVSDAEERMFVLKVASDGKQESIPVTGPAQGSSGAALNNPGIVIRGSEIVYPAYTGEIFTVDFNTGKSRMIGKLPDNSLGQHGIYTAFDKKVMHFIGQDPESSQWTLYTTDLRNGETKLVAALDGLEDFLIHNDVSINGMVALGASSSASK